MLVVGPNLSTFTLGAGEPFLLQVAFQNADGTRSDRNDRPLVLAFFKADRTQLAKIDGELSADGTFVRFEEDGSLSDSLYGQSVSVELAERLRKGREDIAIGQLAVKPTANDVASLANGAIGNLATRVVVRDAATLGAKPTFTVSIVAYAEPSAAPAPGVTSRPSIASDGTPQVGETMTGVSGTYTNGSVSDRAWLLNGSAISGANGASYVPQATGSLVYRETVTGPGGSIASGSDPVTVAAASAMAMPSGYSFRWKAADAKGADGNTPADGGGVASWADSLGAVTATQPNAGKRPIYRAATLNGLPAVEFDGANSVLPGTSTAAFDALTGGSAWTCAIVMSAVDWVNTQGQACPFGSYGRTGQFWPQLGNGGVGAALPGLTGNGLFVWLIEMRTDVSSEQFNFLNATAYGSGIYNQTFAGGFSIGSIVDGYGPGYFKGRIHEIYWYPRALNQVEAATVQRSMCDTYGQAYPWAGKSSFHVYHGDSITYGYTASGFTAAYPYKSAQTLGRGVGTWTSLGFVGFNYGQLTPESQKHVDGLSAVTGIPTCLIFFEWANEARTSGNGDPHATALSYLQARRSADPTVKIVFGSSTDATSSDYSSAVRAGRPSYNSYWDTAANRAGVMDGYAAIHVNANIGVVGAADSATYFNDKLHPTDAGYTILAQIMSSAITAAGFQ